MEEEQWKRVVDSLVEFVERTSRNEESPPEAFATLPEVARLLFDVKYSNIT